MKNEAKANEASDKAEREKVEKINQADSLIFQTEKQLKEYGDKIPVDKKTFCPGVTGYFCICFKMFSGCLATLESSVSLPISLNPAYILDTESPIYLSGKCAIFNTLGPE